MGCDIHVHTEVKLDGRWEHYGSPNVRRRYALFEKMAGVRGEEKYAISPPKGLPHDITYVTKVDAERWEGDAHSHSWLSRNEIAELYKWWEKESKAQGLTAWLEDDFGFCFNNGWEHLPERGEFNGRLTDVRWVFWFDN